jgi:hypothetical protein
VAILLALLFSSSPGWSDDATEAARRHFKRGQRAYNAGRYADALKSFERAYRLKPLPGFLFNLGQCHRKLGHHERALEYFSRYLREGAEGPNRKKARRLVKVLKRKQRKKERAASPSATDSVEVPRGEVAPPLPPTAAARARELAQDAPPPPGRSSEEHAPPHATPAPSEVAPSKGPPTPEPAAAPSPQEQPAPSAEPTAQGDPVAEPHAPDPDPAPSEQASDESQPWWIWAVAGGGVAAAVAASAIVVWLVAEGNQPVDPEPSLGYWDVR